MKKAMKKLFAMLLVFCMALQAVPAAVFAESGTDLPDNDELFAMYVEQVLYDREWATFGTAAREKLNSVEQAIYDALKAQIEAVAAGGGSTAFALSDISGLKTEWTNEELGVESIEDTAEAKAQFLAQFSMSTIVDALLSDCPFDLYWFDKTVGASISYSMGRSGQSVDGTTYWTKLTFKNLTFTFQVASGYQGGDSTTVTSEVAKISTAKAGAQAIVDAYASMTDYEKLVGYKTEICDLVSYNHDAADDDYTGGYGDPWQLIYVFDGDTATNVVCEGYAKAFQYLCDLGGLDCISVSGVMSGGTGAGGHMWNIVTLEGANYLVDVTNCDEGTVGAPDGLFLVGNAAGSPAEGYAFALGAQTIIFAYDTDTTALWSESELTLAQTDYEPGAAPCTHESYENGACTGCGMGAIVNAATGADYTTVAAALAEAGEGETVRLMADCVENHVLVYPGVTLDLNGFVLQADYAVGFDTAHMIDSVGTGRLAADVRKLILDDGNEMIPLYDGDGYIFDKAGFALRQDEKYTGEGIKINAMAYPYRMDAVKLLQDGGADNNIQLVVVLSWDTADGTGSQKFVFTDQLVGEVYSSNQGNWYSYAKMFSMTITGFGSIENLKANLVVVSGTNAETISKTSVSIS